MAEHTRGEWRYEEETYLVIAGDESTHGLVICDVEREDLILAAEMHANGRLIAASPDLLAACEALVKTCQERFEGLEIVALVPGDLRRAVDAGVAAIKLTKGV